MCAGDVLVSCDVSDKWRVEGIVGWTGGRVGACVCEVQHALDGGFGICVPMSCRRYAVGMYVRSCLESCFPAKC